MPQMGVSVSEGTIVEWRKQVGDWVEYEEPIVDISTDKIDTEVPSPAAGRLAEIVVEVGTTVDVGTVLAKLATDAKPGQAHASEQNGAQQADQHTVHTDVNLGIAVSLGEDGLIVPVIRQAQDLSAEGLSKRIKELARAARSRTLRPDDVQDGTFTITNPGQYGSVMATPVINQPQVAILDIEAVVKRPVVVTDADGNDSIAIRPITVLGMSWDHRALDGALAAQFLAAVKRNLEAWSGV